jgi:hypothetical protein
MAILSSNEIVLRQNKTSHGSSRDVQHEFWTCPLLVNPTAADVINFGYLPAYARVVGACISADRIDTNGAPSFALTVGDGGYGSVAADPARYFTATTIGRAATPFDANASNAMNGRAQNFWNNEPLPLLITATIGTAAATFAAGNVYLRMAYYVDEPASPINQ